LTIVNLRVILIEQLLSVMNERRDPSQTSEVHETSIEPLERELADEKYQAFKDLAQQQPDARVFVVGGAVRDGLLNKPAKDIDFLITGVPHDQLEKFLGTYGGLNLVGKKFGVYKFRPKGARMDVDVALPRTEKASGRGGYRDFEVQYDHRLPVETDLARRDFTINALAYEVGSSRVVDPYAGMRDLQHKIIRAVGSAEERFSEDRTRMLRAVRFATKLGFEIDPVTERVIQEHAAEINETHGSERVVPNELIGREFVNSFAADPVQTLELLERTKLLPHVLPEFDAKGDMLVDTKRALARLKLDASLNLKFSVLFRDLGKDSVALAQTIMKRLSFSMFAGDPRLRIDQADILHNVQHHELQNIREVPASKAEKVLFYPNGRPRFDLLELARVDQEHDSTRHSDALKRVAQIAAVSIEQLEQAQAPQPLVRGQDLVEAGFKPGPAFSKMLDQVREQQLSGKITNKQEAIEFVRKNADQ
jgi:tRNA nucleotidyltransferase (CCA-adding enzyme)